MEHYEKLTESTIEELKAIVGEKYVLTTPETLETYQTDQETDSRFFHVPEAVAAPGSTEEVAAIMKLANKRHFFRNTPLRRDQRLRRSHCCLRWHCHAHGAHEPHLGSKPGWYVYGCRSWG